MHKAGQRVFVIANEQAPSFEFKVFVYVSILGVDLDWAQQLIYIQNKLTPICLGFFTTWRTRNNYSAYKSRRVSK